MFLAASLHEEPKCGETVLLYARNSSAEQREAMTELATVLRDWKIVWIEAPNPDKSLSLTPEVTKLASSAREIWVCMPRGRIEVEVCSAASDTPVVLYNDGLGTFEERERFAFSRPKASIRFLRGLIDRFAGTKFETKISRAVLTFPESIPLPRLIRRIDKRYVNDGTMREIFGKAKISLPSSAQMSPPENVRSLLVLGQCFSKFKDINLDQELSVYRSVLEYVNRLGYHVVWKDHPKAHIPFGNRLKAMGLNISVVESQKTIYPVELIINDGFRACLSGTSSALFTLPQFRKIDTFNFASDLIPVLNGADKQVAKMVAKCNPNFSLLEQ